MTAKTGLSRWGETPGEPVQPQNPHTSGLRLRGGETATAAQARGRALHQQNTESTSSTETVLRVSNYDLDATLDSGQAFRWQPDNGGWTGVIGRHQVQLTRTRDGIHAETNGPVTDWQWLHDYLQTGTDLDAVLQTFPDDAPMRSAVAACPGLRILRQDPWECLASFILSSTKQIVQIRQIIALLCERFGEPIHLSFPKGGAREENRFCFALPTPQRIAAVSEADLRACKMGFRAPNLLAAAQKIAAGNFDLEGLRHLPLAKARAELMTLRGVGGKIADCVLLFAYGFDAAFPVDVWVERALRELYFPRRRVGDKRLRHFAATHFGPHAGYAQQYLFHYMRTKMK
jgi:N-glycosylase/DNA lyase